MCDVGGGASVVRIPGRIPGTRANICAMYRIFSSTPKNANLNLNFNIESVL
jgi:hypothetical protein